MVVAVIADIVGSRRLADREAAQATIDDAIVRAERDLPLATQVLTPTVGDELQAVYDNLPDALVSLLMVQLLLADGPALRFGIGVGEIRALESARGILSDGPGWYAAREAIERVDARYTAVPRSLGAIVGAEGHNEHMRREIAVANAYLLTRDELVGAMSPRERRLSYGRILGRSQHELAQAEGVSQPSVSKSLRRAGTAALLEGVAALREGAR